MKRRLRRDGTSSRCSPSKHVISALSGGPALPRIEMRICGDRAISAYCSLASGSHRPVSRRCAPRALHAAACAMLCGGTQECAPPPSSLLVSAREFGAVPLQHAMHTARSSAVAARSTRSHLPRSPPPHPLHGAPCAMPTTRLGVPQLRRCGP